MIIFGRKKISAHLILKIDTQGAEYQVFQGMAGVIASRYVACVMEFTPHALVTSIDALQFLTQLGQRFLIVDVGQQNLKNRKTGSGAICQLLNTSDYDGFVANVRERPYGWTDLLLVPKKLPALNDLLSQLGIENTAGVL